MKKKIGEIYNKPIVVGNKNEINKNEIHVDELVTSKESESKELERNDINFFDYDGTLLYAYTWEEAKNLTQLPPLPTHGNLEVKEWNYTLEDIKAQGTKTTIGKVDVGACCYGADGEVVMNPDVLIIPRGVEELPNYYDKAIGVLSIPNTIIYSGTPSFNECIFTQEVKIPTSLRSQNIDNYSILNGCVAPSIYVNGVVSSPNGYYYHCSPMRVYIPQESMVAFTDIGYAEMGNYIKFPKNTAFIGRLSYSLYDRVNIFDFSKCLAVPTLDSTTSSFEETVFIIVPDSLFSVWKSATNWSGIANKIFPVSQYKNIILK